MQAKPRFSDKLSHWGTRAFFEGASLFGRLMPEANPRRHGVEVVRNVPYLPGGEPRHRLDVYRPVERADPLPIVVYLHGGGFSMLSKDTHWVMALSFARAGYVVFNIGYRLAPLHPFPAALEDVSEALAFVAQHAAAYGGDLERLVLAGESAGANLACSVALMACYHRPEPYARRVFDSGIVPRAVIAACGFLQVSDPLRLSRRRKVPSWVQRMQSTVSQSYLGALRDGTELADPLLILEQNLPSARPLPAFFAFAGTRDPVLDDTRRLAAALARAGVPHEAHYYKGELHAFHALVFLPAAQACWRAQLAFLTRVLGLPPSRRASEATGPWPSADACRSAAS
ncbi:MAG: hypothetical protein JWN04_1157 [Myxococcaceae bacterium]|nr:hypothetical protein [Myxococcaceae bacterium]